MPFINIAKLCNQPSYAFAEGQSDTVAQQLESVGRRDSLVAVDISYKHSAFAALVELDADSQSKQGVSRIDAAVAVCVAKNKRFCIVGRIRSFNRIDSIGCVDCLGRIGRGLRRLGIYDRIVVDIVNIADRNVGNRRFTRISLLIG